MVSQIAGASQQVIEKHYAADVDLAGVDMAFSERQQNGNKRQRIESSDLVSARKHGARDRIRTGDPQLGKLMLYQLSYSRLVK